MRNFAKLLLLLVLCAVLLLSAVPLSACDVPFEKAVKYSKFGAVGDGVTDDFAAIVATHNYANEHHLAVKADNNATYYIGNAADEAGTHTKAAIIRTNTYWGKAKFIVDDRNITDKAIKGADIFVVESYSPVQRLVVPDGLTLKAGQKNVGMTFDGPKLLVIVNNQKRDFIRSGADRNSGSYRQETILVDKRGNVDKSTPILWDYDQVTEITAYSTTDKRLVISGGEFQTISNNNYLDYYNRGISVKRSNTVVRGVQHTVIDEVTSGSPYNGFFVATRCTNVTFENLGVWGHLTPIRTNGSTIGTYDITATHANNITWKNCTQLNDYKTGWGVMGSNFCKNLKMIGCKLSRFDAHQGVCNVTIKDTTLGQTLSVVGFGRLYLENVTRDCIKDNDYGEAHFINLRNDYGSFWHGDIVFKNCTMDSNATVNYLIREVWTDWDYGYTCYLPTTVRVENVTVNYTGSNKKPSYWVFSKIDSTQTTQTMAASKNPLVVTEKVTLINCPTDFQLTLNETGLLDSTKLERK